MQSFCDNWSVETAVMRLEELERRARHYVRLGSELILATYKVVFNQNIAISACFNIGYSLIVL